jgi:hypothetical protein
MTEFWGALINELQNANFSLVSPFFCLLDTPYVTVRLVPDGSFLYFVFGIFTNICQHYSVFFVKSGGKNIYNIYNIYSREYPRSMVSRLDCYLQLKLTVLREVRPEVEETIDDINIAIENDKL